MGIKLVVVFYEYVKTSDDRLHSVATTKRKCEMDTVVNLKNNTKIKIKINNTRLNFFALKKTSSSYFYAWRSTNLILVF